MLDHIKNLSRLAKEYAVLAVYLAFPRRDQFLRRMAESEIGRLMMNNPGFASHRKSRVDKIGRWLDDHWSVIGVAFAVTAASAALAIFQTSGPAGQIDIGPESPVDISNFHSITTTVQVTVLALIIPLAVVLHEFVLTGRRLTKNAISFFLKGSKVTLITVSSVAYLAWVVIFEAASPYLGIELHPLAAAM